MLVIIVNVAHLTYFFSFNFENNILYFHQPINFRVTAAGPAAQAIIYELPLPFWGRAFMLVRLRAKRPK